MKRKVLCLFSFLLILLVFCTCISPKAEEEMHTLVDARHGEAKGKRNMAIANIAIIWPESNDVLFNIVEGTGWESGLQIAEIPSAYFDRSEGHVELGAGTDYWYLYSASRDPIAGDPVTLVEETRKGDDTYLLWYPERITGLDQLPNSMAVLNQTENAALVSMRSAIFPFFEHTVWYGLHGKMGDDLRIYSLTEVSQFLDAIPWIAAIAAVLLGCLILWAGSFLLFDKMGKRKITLWLNILLIVGFLGCLPWLTQRFDLPASLMPKEYILDISHYAATFDRILSALNAMGNFGVKEALQQAATVSFGIIGGMVLVAFLVVIAEAILFRFRNKKREAA